MAKFNVEIVETLSRVIEVDAEDIDEALFIAEEMYNNDEVELDYNDKESTDFKEYPYPRFQEDFSMDIDYSKKDNKIKVKSGDLIDSEHSCKDVEELKTALSEAFTAFEKENYKNRIKMSKEMKERQSEEKEK